MHTSLHTANEVDTNANLHRGQSKHSHFDSAAVAAAELESGPRSPQLHVHSCCPTYRVGKGTCDQNLTHGTLAHERADTQSPTGIPSVNRCSTSKSPHGCRHAFRIALTATHVSPSTTSFIFYRMVESPQDKKRGKEPDRPSS